MDLQKIAAIELIKKGVSIDAAKKLSKELFTGFYELVAEKYAEQKWKEACRAQRIICRNTKLLTKSSKSLEMSKAIQVEIEFAPEPVFK